MDAIVKKKENVCNPMDLMNTIGRELQEIFELSSIKDGETRLGIKDLASKERLNDRQVDKVCEILGRGDEMKDFIKSFQDNYELQKAKAKESYAQSKKNFTKLKKVLPLLRNEFNVLFPFGCKGTKLFAICNPCLRNNSYLCTSNTNDTILKQ